MTLLHGLDLLSTFVFALVGARVAADKSLDYGGITFVAGGAVVILTRIVSIRFDLHLPKFNAKN